MERIEERIATRREERGAILMPGPSPGTPEFSYGFEDQPNGGIPSYFGSDNADPTSGFYFSSRSGVNSPEVSTDRAFEGSKSLKFHYDAWPCGGAGSCHQSEIRYLFANGGSILNAQEWWVHHRVWIPSTYDFTNQAGPNRKFMMMHDQQDNTGVLNFETWPIGSTDEGYMSCNLFWWNGSKVNVGHCHQESSNAFIESSDKSTWMDVHFHIKMSSSSGAQDGFAKVYKNQSLYTTFSPTSCWGGSADIWWNGKGIGGGYYLGYQNVGYSSGADFYIDPIEWSLSDVWSLA